MSGNDMSLDEFLCYVDIYCEKKYYAHLERLAGKIKTYPGLKGATATFWHAFALSQQDQHTEAMRDLNELTENRTVQFAAAACLANVHKASRYKNKDEVTANKNKLKTLSRESGHESLLFAARFFWHSDKLKQARQCIEKVLKAERKTTAGWSLYGWVSLSEGGL